MTSSAAPRGRAKRRLETSRPEELALYEDAALYDATYRRRRRDVEYYVRCALEAQGSAESSESDPAKGPVRSPLGSSGSAPARRVLEYGVGSGRVALATGRAGVEVFGIDASAAMVRRLQEKLARLPKSVASRVRVRQGDMRSARLGERFSLVTAPFNVVLHLDSWRDMERWLTRVRQHLAPGGELVFDVSVPQPADLGADPTRWYRARPFRHPETGRLTRQAERFEYDPIRQVLLVEAELWAEGSRRPRRVPLVHRQWFPRELEALLHYNGFSDIRFTADFTDDPPGADVDSLVIRCRSGAST